MKPASPDEYISSGKTLEQTRLTVFFEEKDHRACLAEFVRRGVDPSEYKRRPGYVFEGTSLEYIWDRVRAHAGRFAEHGCHRNYEADQLFAIYAANNSVEMTEAFARELEVMRSTS